MEFATTSWCKNIMRNCQVENLWSQIVQIVRLRKNCYLSVIEQHWACIGTRRFSPQVEQNLERNFFQDYYKSFSSAVFHNSASLAGLLQIVLQCSFPQLCFSCITTSHSPVQFSITLLLLQDYYKSFSSAVFHNSASLAGLLQVWRCALPAQCVDHGATRGVRLSAHTLRCSNYQVSKPP